MVAVDVPGRPGRFNGKLALAACLLSAPVTAETIVLRSGNGTLGGPDSQIHLITGPSGSPLRPIPFTAGDFSASCAGQAASIVRPCVCWVQTLPSDPAAQWIGLDGWLTANSALYCQEFEIASADICSASIRFAVAVDDQIGDYPAEPNVAGLYLNGNPLPAFTGGNYISESTYSDPAVAGFLHPGLNQLHVYQRDSGFSISGTIYSVEITIDGAPAAAAGPDVSLCASGSTVLDASGSSSPSCTGGLEYRWTESGFPPGPWGTSPTLPVTPATTTSYDLEVRCATAPDCVGTDSVTVAIAPALTASAGSDQRMCAGAPVTLDGSASSTPACAAGLEYRWSVAGVPLAPWGPSSAPTVTPLTTTSYDLEVRCASAPACIASDSVTVAVDPLPLAVAGADQALCEGASGMLDGSGSSVPGCAGALEYRWYENGVPLGTWSTSPSAPVTPAATATYELEVRCDQAPSCIARDQTVVEVFPLPVSYAGPDQSGCADRTYYLSGWAASRTPCAGIEYRWLKGATVVQGWGLSGSLSVVVAADTTYTLEARCYSAHSCQDADTVFIDVRDCSLAVVYADLAVHHDPVRGNTVSWTTLSEAGTLGFQIRVREDGADAELLPGGVEASGAGTSYHFEDTRPAARTPSRLWYQVVELTDSGVGDASAWQPASGIVPGASSGGRRRQSSSGRSLHEPR